MAIQASRASVAFFLLGLVFLVVGAFALGTATATGADAANRTPYRTVWINYLAPKSGGLGSSPANCGLATNKMTSQKNWVGKLGYPWTQPTSLDNMMVCRAYLRVVP